MSGHFRTEIHFPTTCCSTSVQCSGTTGGTVRALVWLGVREGVESSVLGMGACMRGLSGLGVHTAYKCSSRKFCLYVLSHSFCFVTRY